MDIEFYPTTPRLVITDNWHAKEIFNRAQDISKGMPCGLIFYFSRKDDGNLQISQATVCFSDPEQTILSMIRVMERPEFKCWTLSDEGQALMKGMKIERI